MVDGNKKELCYPEFPNNSCWKPLSNFETFVCEMLLHSMSGLIVVLNLFIIISVSHFRQLHTPTNILLLSLAVSDFLVGLLLMPVQTVLMFHCWFFGNYDCFLYRFATDIVHSASVMNMVFISVDRYVAICDPLHYRTRITLNRVKFCVFLLWSFSFLYNFNNAVEQAYQQVHYAPCYGSCPPLVSNRAAVIDLALNFVVPLTIIIVLYTRVFVVAVSQARAMRSHITAVTKQISGTKTAKKSELKAARTLGVLVVVFLICLMPTYFKSLLNSSSTNRSAQLLTVSLYYLNSFANPLIYALFYSWFRKTVKLIITLQILQPGSSEAKIL